MDVLVTGADQRQGLAVIRSLGRQGISVLAAGPGKDCVGFHSRYADASWVYPPPLENPLAFVDSICEAIQKYQIPVVFPVVESTLLVLNENRGRIEVLSKLAAASREAVDLSMDKRRQFSLAAKMGIPIPKTFTPDSMEEAREGISEYKFPMVIKPSVKPIGVVGEAKSIKVSYVERWEELQGKLEIYYRNKVSPVIQEICVGNGIGCGVIMKEGEALACYQYDRGREMLPTGGVPVRYESMPLWPGVQEYSVGLLRAMNWNGVAQVEWKRVPETEEVVLMEVNGRFWASLPGSLHAGMDFPFWFHETFKGKAIPVVKNYRIGIASRYLRGDLNRLEMVLRQRPQRSSVPLPSKRREIIHFFKDFFIWKARGDIHSWDDLKPGLAEAANLIKGYIGRFGRRLFRA